MGKVTGLAKETEVFEDKELGIKFGEKTFNSLSDYWRAFSERIRAAERQSRATVEARNSELESWMSPRAPIESWRVQALGLEE